MELNGWSIICMMKDNKIGGQIGEYTSGILERWVWVEGQEYVYGVE